tara:strand:+ start:899 stop:1072 length:174 start_codon:yes stop_codon:yes gene_type:complete
MESHFNEKGAETMSEARQYLVEQATNPVNGEDEDMRETAQALLLREAAVDTFKTEGC